MVPIAINTLWGVDLQFSDQDLTLLVDQFGERYLQSAAERLANMIDGDGTAQYSNVYNFAGTPGTTPTSLGTYTSAGVQLANSACPAGSMRSCVINPSMEAAILGFNANLFNPVKEISEQYRSGKMGDAVGFKFSMDQNVQIQTLGTTAASTPLVNGANQTGSSLITNGWADSTQVLNLGDIIAVSGMDSVNPISYQDTGFLRSFVVTANVTSDVSGNATIPISPDINADPASTTQTVVAAPANGAAIFVYGVKAANFSNISAITSPQALAFHKQAFALCIVKQELPGGMEWSELVSDPKTGMSARLVRGYSITDNQKYTRFETLGGWKTIRPEFACRICS